MRRTGFGFLCMAAFAISSLQTEATFAQTTSSSADAVGPIEGDYNSNGLVEQQDLDLVLMGWGNIFDSTSFPTWTNDLPDGLIDQGELDKVLGNWGNTGSTIVPEPSSVWLLLAGGAGAYAIWRRRQVCG